MSEQAGSRPMTASRDEGARARKTSWLFLGLLALLLAAAFWWTFRWMAIRWDQANSYYSHGWLVPFISAYLVWRRRKELSDCPVRPSLWGPVLLLPALLVHVLASAWQVGFLSGFALLGVLGGLVLSLWGRAALRLLAFPIVFLGFMVPVPVLLVENVSFTMKILAARCATAFVELIGIPAVREGSYVRMETGTVVVDDVCSGLKYLIALTAFGALYAHISSVGKLQKAALFALSIPIAFVANVVRVILMLLVASQWGPSAVEAWYFHDFFGFALFVTAFLLLFLAESLFLKDFGLSGRLSGQEEAGDAPDSDTEQVNLRTRRLPSVRVLAVGALGLAVAASLFFSWPRPTAHAQDVFASVPLELGPWQGRDQALSEREYDLLGTREVLSRVYADESYRTAQLVVVLAEQMRRRTHPPEYCYTGEGFTIRRSTVRSVHTGTSDGKPLQVRELMLDRRDGRRIVWYFYTNGHTTHTSYWAHQASVAFSKLTDPDSPDVLVRVDAAAARGGEEAARELLRGFLSRTLPPVMDALR
ncbi:MAG: exosortase C-terminal domain/associated protein EpsI [Planctomycetota bacterium]